SGLHELLSHMYGPSHGSPSWPTRGNVIFGACSVPSRPEIDHRIKRSRVTDTTSLSGWSSGLVCGCGVVDVCGGALSGSEVSICVKMMPAEIENRRNSIKFVTMSR